MIMFKLDLIPFAPAILICCLFVTAQGQLLDNEIPASVKYLYEGDLDTWEPPKEVLTRFPIYLSGYDFENRPVWILETGKWETRDYLHSSDENELILFKYLDQFVYKAMLSVGDRATSEKPVKEAVIIVDFNGYRLSEFTSPRVIASTVRLFRRILDSLTFVDDFHMVNCNAVAQNMVNIIRPLLGRYGEKVVIHGTNKQKWLPILLKKIPREALSPSLGGPKDFVPLRLVA